MSGAAKVGLANERSCQRLLRTLWCAGGAQNKVEQWMVAITKYADRLIDDLDDLDFY